MRRAKSVKSKHLNVAECSHYAQFTAFQLEDKLGADPTAGGSHTGFRGSFKEAKFNSRF